MSYVQVVETALIIFPFIAMLITAPYMIYNYHKYGSVFSLKVLVFYSFILYMMCVIFLVTLPLPSMEEVARSAGQKAQLQPLMFIKDILKEARKMGGISFIHLVKNRATYQFVFNILMLVPFGMYMRYYFKMSRLKTVLLSFLFSLFLETSQLTGIFGIYPKAYRTFDVDDLLANTLGGLFGWFLTTPFLFILPSRSKLNEESYIKGEQVSLTRRSMAFLIDLGIYMFIYVFGINLFNWKDFGVGFALYMLISACLFKDRTPGMLACSLAFATSQKKKPGFDLVFLRYVYFFGAFIFLPKILSRFVEAVPSVFISAVIFKAFALMAIWGIWFYKGCRCLYRIKKHEQTFYGKWSDTMVISSIKVPNIQ